MQFLSVIDRVSCYAAAGYVLPFLFVLTVIVFFHELGHFLVARWCGVTVKVFSIGFGKEIFGFTDRKGTRWRLSSIPLGGFVRFLGDENEASVTNREALSHLKPEERRARLRRQECGGARRDRRRGSDRQHDPRDRDPDDAGVDLWQAADHAADRRHRARQPGGPCRLRPRRPRQVDQWAYDRQLQRGRTAGRHQRWTDARFRRRQKRRPPDDSGPAGEFHARRLSARNTMSAASAFQAQDYQRA